MADDVIVAAGTPGAMESAQRSSRDYGVLDLFGGLSPDDAVVGLDGRAIHYGEFTVTGSSGGGPHDLAVALELMGPGGSTRRCTSVTSAAWNTPRTSSR